MNNANQMIILDDVKKTYDNGLVVALAGVSFSIQAGEIVSITGPSGCGKSTLLNLIGSLDRPTSGEIFYQNRRIKDHKPLNRFRAKNIGFIFQFHHLIPTMTLLENVEIQMIPLGIPQKIRTQKATSILSALGLNGRKNFLPVRTSGGERQRAAIARALVHEPRLILADEPTGNLDTDNGDQAINHIISLCRQIGTTAIIATHNPDVASRADRSIRMKNGKIEE